MNCHATVSSLRRGDEMFSYLETRLESKDGNPQAQQEGKEDFAEVLKGEAGARQFCSGEVSHRGI